MKHGAVRNLHGPIVLVVGTRPEGIKLIPVYQALKRLGESPLICSTMQHDAMLTQVFDLFGVKPDFDLEIMRFGQDLFYVTQSVLQKTKELFIKIKPRLVVVQGDTTSSMVASLSAFYLGIPIVHVEAGLRTDDLHSPFPEEMNRRVIASLATIHCAPTTLAADNLRAAGILKKDIFITGNTVVDALYAIKNDLDHQKIVIPDHLKKHVEQAQLQHKKIMVLTAHRRESFDGGLDRILSAVKSFLVEHQDVICFYPFHPNPAVVQAINRAELHSIANMVISEPIGYKDMVYLLLASNYILTDSGGIQEEAVSLGKTVLVLREKTERMEGVIAGYAHVVGTDQVAIYNALIGLHSRSDVPLVQGEPVYGDGSAGDKIAAIIQNYTTTTYGVPEHESCASVVSYEKKGKNMNLICIVGLGYIGLPTAIVAVDHGCTVVGVDIDKYRVDKINAGDPVIHEPEIYEKLQVALGTGRLRASTTIEVADYFMIAVPTPFKENKLADLSYVYSAGQEIATVLKKGDVVILESTIPVGTTEAFALFLQEKTGLVAGQDFYVAHCPERVLPGNIFTELIENDRIIGGINEASVHAAKKLYNYFVQGTLYLTDAATAEMVKLVENSSRDVQIAFANQVASMAYSVGLNPFEVIELANKHPRVDILKPGCGVGGHCIAVDPWFLVETFPAQTTLLHAARLVNDGKPLEVIQCVRSAVDELKKTKSEKKCTVGIFGLTYKADVDDLRESPAMYIAQRLKVWDDVNMLVVEPHVHQSKVMNLFPNQVSDVTTALQEADIVLFLVGHTRFKAIDKKQLYGKKVLDFCGLLYEPKKQSDQKEHMFWPARSKMDFFASQHIAQGTKSAHQPIIKEDAA